MGAMALTREICGLTVTTTTHTDTDLASQVRVEVQRHVQTSQPLAVPQHLQPAHHSVWSG